ncbi:DUF3450 domain-containing protein [Vibrio sp. RC27]
MNNIVKPMRLSLLIATIAVVGHSYATSIDSSSKVEQTILANAQKSQTTISNSSDRSFELQNDIKALSSEVNNLEVYKQHLETLIENQNQELLNLEVQRNEIIETRQSIVPLMYNMLDGLEAYIAQDMPIRKDAREQRVATLKSLMSEANISDSEKYRRILEAYQIELDYVNKMGIYTSAINIDGETREIEQLYLGHISLIARSLDQQQYWYWNNDSNSWQGLDVSLNMDLEKAFMVANKEVTPTLLMLPLSVNEASAGEASQ